MILFCRRKFQVKWYFESVQYKLKPFSCVDRKVRMMPFSTGKGDLEHLNDEFQTHQSKVWRVLSPVFWVSLGVYGQHAFSLEVLGFPPSFKGWFQKTTSILVLDYHHPKKSLPFWKWWLSPTSRVFSHVFFCLNSLYPSRMIVTIWFPWVSRLTRRMRGEGKEKAVGRRFFGRFVECAP